MHNLAYFILELSNKYSKLLGVYCGLYKSNKCSFYPQSFHLKYLNNYSLHSIRQANGV